MFTLPNDKQKSVIVGKTGSGKTVAGIWQLSKRSWDRMPWVILDTKRDELINAIPGTEEISIYDSIPTKPGLYIAHPLPDELEAMENFQWKLWEKEHVGIFIDEGYMIGKSKAFNALLTQGRSKIIPMIILSQRPVWISRFVMSETDFVQAFWLNDERDRDTVGGFLPADMHRRLPPYHSVWYDVGADKVTILGPTPNSKAILESFSKRQDVVAQEPPDLVRRYKLV